MSTVVVAQLMNSIYSDVRVKLETANESQRKIENAKQ